MTAPAGARSSGSFSVSVWGVRGGGARVVNVTAVDGLGNAEATGLLVNLWTV